MSNKKKTGASFISKQVTKGEYYYLNLTPGKHSGEHVVCGGREQCAPNYYIKRKGFRFHSIEFVSSGKGVLSIHGNQFPLRPGAVFSYGPQIRHVIETDPEQPLLKHFVDFTGSELVNLLKTTAFRRNHPLYVSSPFRIRSIFENLISTGNTESRNRDTLCVLLLRQLILSVDDCAMDAEAAFSPAWQTYLRCRHYIERNYLEIGSIKEVAERCFVDQAYLARLFKRFTEETPLQLLTRLRMNRAADMLGNDALLVKQVAEAFGFTDPYHFSRTFKRVHGIAPESFRRAVQRTE
jgi:AraC-like DNA-binding protein